MNNVHSNRYNRLKMCFISYQHGQAGGLTLRIYSIKRPGHLLNFWTLRVGAYSRWVLIKFSPFSASSKFILQQNSN